MPYPRDWIMDLKHRVSIVKVIGRFLHLKYTPVRRGGGRKEYRALCPFHREETASFFVSGDKQFFHCFGCGGHGNVFAFLKEYKGITYPEAIREVAKIAGVRLPHKQQGNKKEKG